MRFAFRCPKVWDRPAVEGLLWCEQCERHVHDLTVLPDLDVYDWVEQHPGACIRAVTDRDGKLWRKMPARGFAIAVVAAPCGTQEPSSVHDHLSSQVEIAARICEQPEEDMGESCELPALPEPQLPGTLELEEQGIVWAYVTAGAPAIGISAAPPLPPPIALGPTILSEEPPPKVKKRRGLFKRLFGRHKRRSDGS